MEGEPSVTQDKKFIKTSFYASAPLAHRLENNFRLRQAEVSQLRGIQTEEEDLIPNTWRPPKANS